MRRRKVDIYTQFSGEIGLYTLLSVWCWHNSVARKKKRMRVESSQSSSSSAQREGDAEGERYSDTDSMQDFIVPG